MKEFQNGLGYVSWQQLSVLSCLAYNIVQIKIMLKDSNGQKIIQSKQRKVIAIQEFVVRDRPAGLRETGLNSASMWNVSNDNTLCKLDTKMI